MNIKNLEKSVGKHSQIFHILTEMSVEFVRHENASAMGAVWEHEGSSLFDQYGESSCSERRNISEYMTSSFGPVANYRNVYKDCMASMKN